MICRVESTMKVNVLLQLLALLVSLPLASCEKQNDPDLPSSNHQAVSPDESVDPSTRLDLDREIEIVASLYRYSDTFQLLHESHRISALKVHEPHRYSDKRLLVRHSDSPDSDSDWRKAGAVFRIRISEDLLDWIVDGIGFIGTQDVEILEELSVIPIGFRPELTAESYGSMSTCWQDLVGKLDELGFDGLADNERVYFLVRIADSVAASGGFHEIWKSPLGEHSPRFAYAFAAIGAGTKAGLFQEFDKMLIDAGRPKGILQRETAHSNLVASENDAIDALNKRYESDRVSVDQRLRLWAEEKAICQSTDWPLVAVRRRS